MEQETRACQNCKNNFAIEPEDLTFYKSLNVPPPTWCWKCRAMRRMAFRNFRYLYERTCAGTGKKIFSMVPPNAPMPPFDRDYWWSDAWDPKSYAREYDFTRPFFDQIRDLFNVMPFTYIMSRNQVNSDYSMGLDMKNTYLCFDAGFSEDSAYGVTLQKSKQCFDTINCKLCELCYYVINTTNCYKTFFSRNCTGCREVWFSQDCVGCNDCVGCTGLRNKSYYIFNQPYSKENYRKKMAGFNLHSRLGLERMQKEAERIWLSFPFRFRHGLQDAGCTGDYIYNSSQVRNCFFTNEVQNCTHCQSVIYNPIRDCMDVTSSGVDIERNYEISCCGQGLRGVYFSFDCETVSDVRYSITCRNSREVFGCVGLRNAQYCILNKQYSKEQYESLIPKIIAHMNETPYVDTLGRIYKYGEFFPPDMSPFGFNESQAYEYFQLPRSQVEHMGFNWRVPEKRKYEPTKAASALPDTIAETGDDIIQEIVQCKHDETGDHAGLQCGANCPTVFRITQQELQFYRKMNLPLPKLCFNCRHVERISWRNVPQLYKRTCACAGVKASSYINTASHFHGSEPCPNKFETTYAPDRPEIVYCEQCYQAEVA